MDALVGQLTPIAILAGFAGEESALTKDCTVLLAHAEPLSHRLSLVAQQYPAVYKALRSMLQAGAIAGLVGEVSVIALAIMGNHGIRVRIPGLPG